MLQAVFPTLSSGIANALVARLILSNLTRCWPDSHSKHAVANRECTYWHAIHPSDFAASYELSDARNSNQSQETEEAASSKTAVTTGSLRNMGMMLRPCCHETLCSDPWQ